MNGNNDLIINEGERWTQEQRRVVENSLRRCNACVHCNFTERACNRDSQNPIPLYVYTGVTGHILLLKPRPCSKYEWRGSPNEE